ncbi:two-component regulator propeller domain-containing protein [Meiothermus sp. CFH 77666]|uniref:two-component regulator propeller domain-containing protein n=1 Tax=Meiothermus sp. CFH 77666 TaxID=2817942 RepID=UPI001AA0A071|nr:hypothetical protein [Meiothermus sp. CFH 77666]
MRRFVLYALCGALLGFLTACGGPNQGVLELEVLAPQGVRPGVWVRGPGFERRLEEAGLVRFAGLNPGEYRVEAEAVEGADGHLYRAGLEREGVVALKQGQTQRTQVEYRVATGKLRLLVEVTPSLPGFAPWVEVRGPNGYSARLEAGAVLRLEPGSYTLSPLEPPEHYTLSIPTRQVMVQAGRTEEVSLVYARGFGALEVEILSPVGVSGFTPGVELRGPDGEVLERLNAGKRYDGLPAGVYTLDAANVTAAGVTWQPSAPSLRVQVPVGGVGRGSLAYTATNSAITVNLSGLGTGDLATVTLQPGNQTRTRTGNGPVRFEGLAFGSYTVSAHAVRPGAWVDRYLMGGQASVQTSSAEALPAVSLSSWTERGGSGRIWVAGNGQFSNGGRGSTSTGELNGAYSLLDGASSFSSFIGPTGSQGPFRIAFDRGGNMYVLYQYISGSSPARIVRISEANLRSGLLSETAPGNTRIEGSVWGWPEEVIPGPHMDVSGNEPADLAFDANGNLWVVNDYLGLLACVRASDLQAAPPSIAAAGTRIWGPGTGLYRYVLDTPGQNADNRPFLIPHALAFDPHGHLWFTSGGYQGPRSGESSPVKRSFLNRLQASRIAYAPNGDCNGGNIGLSESNLGQWVDIRLDISLPDSDYGAIVKPVAMALEPGGGAIWVGDFGGNSGGSADLYRDANALPETLLRIPLAGANLTTGAAWRTAWVSHRLTIGAGAGPDKGLQQVFGLAFDRDGYLWVATNNNVEVLPTDTGTASAALTDRRGKLYRLDVRGYVGQTATYSSTTDLRSAGLVNRTLSVADTGVGLIGVALNLPNPTSLPHVYP